MDTNIHKSTRDYWNRLEESFKQLLEEAPAIIEKENYHDKHIGNYNLDSEKQLFRIWAANQVKNKVVVKAEDINKYPIHDYFQLPADTIEFGRKEFTWVLAEEIDTSYENLLKYFYEKNQDRINYRTEKERLQAETLEKAGYNLVKPNNQNTLQSLPINPDKDITDIIRIIYALYKKKYFPGATLKDIMDRFGSFLNVDLKNHSVIISQSFNKIDPETNVKIFDQLKDLILKEIDKIDKKK